MVNIYKFTFNLNHEIKLEIIKLSTLILKMRKLRFITVKRLIQGHRGRGGLNGSPAFQHSKTTPGTQKTVSTGGNEVLSLNSKNY